MLSHVSCRMLQIWGIHSSHSMVHLVIAADLVKAAKAGNQKAVTDAEKKWYSNADEITEFLSRINPHLTKEKFRSMFYKHLALTKSEAVSILGYMNVEKPPQPRIHVALEASC
jgi:hypothetical protein